MCAAPAIIVPWDGVNHVALLIAAWLVLLLPRDRAHAETSRELRARAANLTYNLDHDVAMQLLRRASSPIRPIPANHRALASAIWFDILSGAARSPSITTWAASPVAASTRSSRRRARRRVQARDRRGDRAGRGARQERCRAIRRRTTISARRWGSRRPYMASVEGRLLAGFRAARHSYDEQERVLELDPQRKEAGLIIGTYRYLVSTLSLPMRVMAYVAGFGGGKERGPADGRRERRGADRRANRRLVCSRIALQPGEALRRCARRAGRPPDRCIRGTGSSCSRRGPPPAAPTSLPMPNGSCPRGSPCWSTMTRRKMPGEAGVWHYRRGVARVAPRT